MDAHLAHPPLAQENFAATPADDQGNTAGAACDAAVAGARDARAAFGMRWYVVHAYAGMEKAVERNIKERVHRMGMDNKFGRILVPVEEVVEIKNGQRRTAERKFFPGYVLVEMVMDDDSWHLVKQTSKVSGFVGGAKNTRPTPITDTEVQKIMNQMHDGSEKPRHKVEFMVGEVLRIKDGPFTDFNGVVEDINYEKSKLRVTVTIFGRATPVELEFSQVEKA